MSEIYVYIYSVLIICVVGIFIYLVNYFFEKVIYKYMNIEKIIKKGIKIFNYEIISEKKLEETIVKFIKILKISIVIFAITFMFPAVFSLFPQTHKLALDILKLFLNPIKVAFYETIGYLPKLLFVLVIVYFAIYFVKMITFFSGEIEEGKLKINGFYPEWAKPTLNIIKILIYAFVFTIIFPYLPGSNSDVFKGVSVFIGIIFSLGSSSYINNMVSGIVLTYMRSFSLNDRVKIGDIIGDIQEKDMLVTRILTTKKEIVIVPNSQILSENIINYTNSAKEYGLLVHTTVTIGYENDWRVIHKLLINAANEILENSTDTPFVLQTSLDDFYVSYQINVRVIDEKNIPQFLSKLNQKIQDNFNKEGIEIMSPHYTAVRNGNNLTINNNIKNEKGSGK